LSVSTPAFAERQTYTVDEAARILGISRNCAYDAVRRGEIPAIRLGRRLVVARTALELLLGGVLPDSKSIGVTARARRSDDSGEGR
jgi:excisionase family DNA binding protein